MDLEVDGTRRWEWAIERRVGPPADRRHPILLDAKSNRTIVDLHQY
jgi:hypothetical protein